MNKVIHVKDLKPLEFLSARKFGYAVEYRANRRRFEWATVVCKSEEECELTIVYNVYNADLQAFLKRTLVIRGTQDQLTPLIYLIEYVVATEEAFKAIEAIK